MLDYHLYLIGFSLVSPLNILVIYGYALKSPRISSTNCVSKLFSLLITPFIRITILSKEYNLLTPIVKGTKSLNYLR